MKGYAALTCIALASVASGCESDAPSGVVVRDSAGVAIVESPGIEPASWHVNQQPLLTIGSETRGEAYQMFRVQGAIRMSDGRIAVANSGSSQIRFYDEHGEYVGASGGDGEGPGEFRSITSLQRLAADTLFAYDRTLGRYSIIAPDGSFVSSTNIGNEGTGPGAMALGSFHNGYVATQHTRGGIFAYVAGESEDPNSEMTVEFHLARGPDSQPVVIGTYPAPETEINMGDNSISVRRNPLSPETWAVASSQALYVGHSGTYELHRYDQLGMMDQIIRYRRSPDPITDSEIDALIASRKESAPNADAARGIEASYREMEFPENFPAFDDLLVDKLGWLWVRDYLRPTADSSRWRIYSPDGVLTAQIAVDRDFRLMDAGRDYILGRLQDDFDLERVRLFELVDRTDSEN